jgi:hypothetical protein
MNSKEKNIPEEEVDLGNLFSSLGRGIRNLLRWIIEILESVFHAIILFLLFLRKHWIKILGSAILGFLIGLALDFTKPKTYVSDMILETNYGSGAQLYKEVNYLEELVHQRNNEALAKVLKISMDDAQSITSIDAKVFEKSRNLRLEYERFLRTSDSIILKQTSYDDFIKRFSEDNFRYHQIRVKSTSNTLFRKISKELSHLVATDYFENIRKIRMDELMSRKLILRDNLEQIDSLRVLYKKVALLNAQKEEEKAALTIDSRQLEAVNKDLSLFELTDQIGKQMAWLNDDIIEKASVVNVVSDFAEVGVVDRDFSEKNSVRLALLFSLISLLIILLNTLNKYLNRYKTNRNI